MRAALSSGAALERFRRMVARQGGDPRIVEDGGRLPAARQVERIDATAGGVVAAVDAERIGVAAMLPGAGRETAGAAIDPAAGVGTGRRSW
ncbi:MAG: hypothetical protein R2712_01205 [Vicinamibacterales bacterium]